MLLEKPTKLDTFTFLLDTYTNQTIAIMIAPICNGVQFSENFPIVMITEEKTLIFAFAVYFFAVMVEFFDSMVSNKTRIARSHCP